MPHYPYVCVCNLSRMLKVALVKRCDLAATNATIIHVVATAISRSSARVLALPRTDRPPVQRTVEGKLVVGGCTALHTMAFIHAPDRSPQPGKSAPQGPY
jgi:hypothetical protein